MLIFRNYGESHILGFVQNLIIADILRILQKTVLSKLVLS